MGQTSLLEINPGLIFWTLITFVILFLLLKKFVWGPVLDAVDRREQSLKNMFDNAEKAQAEAKQLLERYENQLGQAKEEVGKILEDGKSRAARSTEEIVQRARRQADEIVERAKVEIDRERQKATDEIKEHVVRISLKAAERLIEKTLDDREHRDLIQQAISEIDTGIE
ncbi:MAG TPA: F0F1 ATP synthase subunit B [archaeon]|nr:F0F1 ATP synthase subunit B [archaeon]